MRTWSRTSRLSNCRCVTRPSDHVDFPVALRDIARELSSDRRLKIHPHADHFLNAPEELSAENRMRQFPEGWS